MKVYVKKKIQGWLEEYTPSGWNWEGVKLFVIKRQWYLIIGLSIILFFSSAYVVYHLNLPKEISAEKIESEEIGQSISGIPVIELQLPVAEIPQETPRVEEVIEIEITPIQSETGEGEDAPQPPKVDPHGMMFPTIGRIHRPFAMDFLIKSETLDQWTVHRGVDIKGEIGVKVFAALDGVVETVNLKDPRWGKVIMIDHGDNIKTLYASLNSIEVTEGKWVDRGDIIGTLGKSAPMELLEGPHLHFEVVIDGVNVNPEIYFKNP